MFFESIVSVRKSCHDAPIADKHTLVSVGLLHNTHCEGMQLRIIRNNAKVGRVGVWDAQDADDARVSVVEGRHGVEDVSDQSRSGSDATDRIVNVRRSVADSHDDPSVVEILDRFLRSFELRSEGHKTDVVQRSIAC